MRRGLCTVLGARCIHDASTAHSVGRLGRVLSMACGIVLLAVTSRAGAEPEPPCARHGAARPSALRHKRRSPPRVALRACRAGTALSADGHSDSSRSRLARLAPGLWSQSPGISAAPAGFPASVWACRRSRLAARARADPDPPRTGPTSGDGAGRGSARTRDGGVAESVTFLRVSSKPQPKAQARSYLDKSTVHRPPHVDHSDLCHGSCGLRCTTLGLRSAVGCKPREAVLYPDTVAGADPRVGPY